MMFEAGLITAVQAAFDADDALKASGTLGVDCRDQVVRSPDGTWGMLPTNAAWDRLLMFSFGGGGTHTALAAMTRGAEYALTLVVLTAEYDPKACAARNHAIRDAAIHAMLRMDGSSHTLVTGSTNQIMVELQGIGTAESYQDHPAVLISETELTVTVVYGTGG